MSKDRNGNRKKPTTYLAIGLHEKWQIAINVKETIYCKKTKRKIEKTKWTPKLEKTHRENKIKKAIIGTNAKRTQQKTRPIPMQWKEPVAEGCKKL